MASSSDCFLIRGPGGSDVDRTTQLCWGAYHAVAGLPLCAARGGTLGALQAFPATCTACAHFLADSQGEGALHHHIVRSHCLQYGDFIESDLFVGSWCCTPERAALALKDFEDVCGEDGVIPVAVKKILSGRTTWDASEALREGAALVRATPSCPYVLRVHGVVEDDGERSRAPGSAVRGTQLALLTELAAGPLTDIVDQASTAQKLLLLYQAAVGVACLHETGLVHGNLRAGCLLLSDDGQLRVASGGLTRTRRAVERANAAAPLSSASHRGGAASAARPKAWSAPELLQAYGAGAAAPTAASDVYAFAVMAWEVLSAKPITPAAADADGFDEVSGRPPSGWRPDVSALPSDSPAALVRALATWWAVDAAQRPVMATVAQQLRTAAAPSVSAAVLAVVDQAWQAGVAANSRGSDSVPSVEGDPRATAPPGMIAGGGDGAGENSLLQLAAAPVAPAPAVVLSLPTTSVVLAAGGQMGAVDEGDEEVVEEDVFRPEEVYGRSAAASGKSSAAAQNAAAGPKSLPPPKSSAAAASTAGPQTTRAPVARVPAPASPSPAPASAGAIHTGPPASRRTPYAHITPIYERNPPVWRTDSADPGSIPPELDDLLAHMPPAVARDVLLAVCVPFYSEDGFALRRGLEALACQRADLRQYWASCRLAGELAAAQPRREVPPPSAGARAGKSRSGAAGAAASAASTAARGLPEMHVFAVADGWRKGDGSYIVSDSMMEEILELFGDSLDVEALLRHLEGPGDEDGDGPPAAVLIQYVVDSPGAPGGRLLSPISLDVPMAQKSVCRESAPRGVVTTAMRRARAAREAERAAQEQQRKKAAWSAFLGFGKGKEQESGGSAPQQPWTAGAGGQEKAPLLKSRAPEAGDASAPSSRGVRRAGPALQPSAASRLDAIIAAEAEAASSPDQPLYFSLLIKRENAKKHHSHRFFFECFAPITRLRSSGRCAYFFATDCGTLYAPFCVAELVAHLEANPSCAAATGHQRIMDKEDQADPASADGETFAEGVLRSVQGYDFESGLCVFNGMHALAGFLPVVPGPCGMFRAAALSDEIIGHVRRICSSDAAEDGLVQGNLKIAEDRILSYLLVLTDSPVAGKRGREGVGGKRAPRKGDGSKARGGALLDEEAGGRDDDDEGQAAAAGGGTPWQTHWVPSTLFFFESESTLRELVLQRRRWLNGTVAGYIWLLRQPKLARGLCACRPMSWRVLTLSLLQVLVFCITFFMPGILMVTGYLACFGALLVLDVAGLGWAYNMAGPVQVTYLALALSTFLAHVVAARVSNSNFTPWIWTVRVALNATLMATNALVVVSLIALSAARPDAIVAAVGSENFEDMQVAAAFGILYTCTPFFLSYLHSPGSFFTMLRTFPWYFLFTPTILADFFSYAVARTDDLSWGTKAVAGSSKGSQGGGGGKRDAALARLAAARKAAQQEGGRAARATKRAVREGQRRNAAARESSWRVTNTLAMVQTGGSLAIALVNYALDSVLHHYLLTVGAVTASVGLVVMLGSFAYFVPRAVCGRAAGGLADRLYALFNALGWLTAAGAVALMWLVDDHKAPLWRDAVMAFATVFGGLGVLALIRFGNCGCGCGGLEDDDGPDDAGTDDGEAEDGAPGRGNPWQGRRRPASKEGRGADGGEKGARLVDSDSDSADEKDLQRRWATRSQQQYVPPALETRGKAASGRANPWV